MIDNALVYGIHSVTAAIEADASRVLELWFDRSRHDMRLNALRQLAMQHGLSVQQADKKSLDKMISGERHQGVVARCRPVRRSQTSQIGMDSLLADISGNALLLILDGVSDPHNLGACLRTAEAAGAHAVIIPAQNAAGMTPAVRKVAAGSAERVPLISVTNLARTIRELKQQNVWVIGADGHSERRYYDIDLTRPVALVLGNEATGMRRLTHELCDEVCALPMFGQAESLNVSVTAGICLYEAVRQRQH